MRFTIYDLRFAILFLVFLTGCLPIPHTTTRSPEIHGRVLDANTRESVKGAKVFLTEHTRVSAVTDSSGYFRIKRTRKFHPAVTIPEGDWPPSKYWGSALTVSHSNYVAYIQRGPNDEWITEKGDILSEPKK